MKRVVALGPGPRFKGGIANYNTSLAKALDRHEDLEVHIISWSRQYPSIVPRDFIDRKSRKDQLEGTGIAVQYLLDYNRIRSWKRTVKHILNLQPDRVVIQWAIAIQGIPLRYVARKLQAAGVRIFFDLHFVVQKENSTLDRLLTRRCIRFADSYVVHAVKTFQELRALYPDKQLQLIEPGTGAGTGQIPALKLYHPVYDMFRMDDAFDADAFRKELGLRKYVFLFFGFIRKYKGLHHVIEAFNIMAREREDVSLLIVGELFWNTLDAGKLSTRLKKAFFGLAKKVFLRKQDDEQDYKPLDLIGKYGLDDRVVAITEFVPNEEVHKYFQVSHAITLFYLTATPSGVESMACNFGTPMLASRVGHFPETIREGYNGYLAEPGDPGSMAGAMRRSIESPIPKENVFEVSAKMSWANYADAILRN